MGVPMEHLTLAPRARTEREGPLPPPAPHAMPEQPVRGFRRQRRLPGESRVRLARAALALAALLLTIVLSHQMWLVLSVGELTSVEQLMLVLFVINIAWIGFGALSP